jgi:hypothetical protein
MAERFIFKDEEMEKNSSYEKAASGVEGTKPECIKPRICFADVVVAAMQSADIRSATRPGAQLP